MPSPYTSGEPEQLPRSIKVLLINPYQYTPVVAVSPPLGLLCLSASLKEQFASQVEVKLLDMKLYGQDPAEVVKELEAFSADIVGVSSLNCEGSASKTIAALVKQYNPDILTVLGGPYAHKRAGEILRQSRFDWVVNGPGDRVFAAAVRRYVNGKELGTDIPGISYRKSNTEVFVTETQNSITDLDQLPFPDWSHVDLDLYAKRPNMMGMLKGNRYALLFTSRGCPYRCNYCHNIFGKRFLRQSPERVVKEIELLYETYGVTEFQIVDDVFNLDKRRLKTIMEEVHRRWPGKIHFTFPNGLRGDILDEEVLDALKLGGTYAMAIAVETATPRLQELVGKHLDLDKTFKIIGQANQRGICVTGYFMVGFPTETVAELEATVQFALRSKLAVTNFFMVIPQPETPMYALAAKENQQALTAAVRDDEEGKLAYSTRTQMAAPWYERAYGFPLRAYAARASRRFYLSPSRILRILRRVPFRSALQGGWVLITLVIRDLRAAVMKAKT